MNTWNETRHTLPPEEVVVLTMICNGDGTRNQQPLKRRGTMWFLPDGSMYVYYTPTHWCELPDSRSPEPETR